MHDVVIIGGGPAGMCVALNLLRAGRSVLILERNSFGGQMATSPRLENIPGIKSISGVDFSDQLFEQITDLGAEFELEEAQEIKQKDNGFLIKTDYGEHDFKDRIKQKNFQSSADFVLVTNCHILWQFAYTSIFFELVLLA